MSQINFQCQSVPRSCREHIRVIEDLNLQLCATTHFSEVFTQTGPSHHEGNGGVSVKPHSQSFLRPSRALLKEFLVTFVSQTKVTRPSACEASGAKQPLTLRTLASASKNPTLRKQAAQPAFPAGFADAKPAPFQNNIWMTCELNLKGSLSFFI